MKDYHLTGNFSCIFQYSLLFLLFGKLCLSDELFYHNINGTDNSCYIDDAQIIFPSLADPATYAIATCPCDTVFIAQSNLSNAGLGVFAARHIPQGIYFGPYFGYKHIDTLVAEQSGYAWTVQTDSGEISYYVDAFDPQYSNWLRYINCPNTISQENLIPVQYSGEFFYKTSRDIDAGEELLVYYGHNYAKLLGINITQFFKAPSKISKQKQWAQIHNDLKHLFIESKKD